MKFVIFCLDRYSDLASEGPWRSMTAGCQEVVTIVTQPFEAFPASPEPTESKQATGTLYVFEPETIILS